MSHSKPGTLVAGEVARVTIADTWPHGITIAKVPEDDGTVTPQPIWYRLDGTDPAALTEDTFICFDAVFIPHPALGGGGPTPTVAQEAVEVRLLCAVAVRYTVEGNPVWKRV